MNLLFISFDTTKLRRGYSFKLNVFPCLLMEMGQQSEIQFLEYDDFILDNLKGNKIEGCSVRWVDTVVFNGSLDMVRHDTLRTRATRSGGWRHLFVT